METLQYLLFSSIEWLCLILLMFAMFKFPLRGYWGQIILTSLVLSLFSHLVFRVLDLRILASFLQPPVTFLLLWQIFRIHIFYAALMTIYGYMGYTLVQMTYVVIMIWIGVPMESLVIYTPAMYLLIALTTLTVLIFTYLLYKFRIGYTFVPDYEYAPVEYRGANLKLLVFLVIGYICLSLINFVTFSSSVPVLFLLFSFVILGVLLYFAQRKEYSGD